MIEIVIGFLIAASMSLPRVHPPIPQRPHLEVITRSGLAAGTASWFRAAPGTAAAGPSLRRALGPHWRGSWVWVSANGRSVHVLLNDWCACPHRVIDLSATSFAHLAPLSRGLVRVSIR